MAPQHPDGRTAIHPDALELADILRDSWPTISADLLASGVPLNEGDPDPDPDPDPADPDPKGGGDPDPDPDPKVTPDDDWKTKSRKNETRAKKAEKEAADLKARLDKIEKESQTEHEQALAKAREEARTEVLTEVEKERRADRLEAAVTRLAAKGVTIGEGDDAKSVKFADSEDALLRVERAIRRGDLDADDLYDDEGKVNADTLTSTLADIATANPHLVGQNGTPKGDPDTRKGGPADKNLESMTPEDHARRKYGAAK